jgi:hypothetical protein
MAATYPVTVKNFTYKIDNKDKVISDDVNAAYDEIMAIETQLGIGGVVTSTWATGNFNTTTTDWSGSSNGISNGALKGRLTNIETGLFNMLTKIDGGTP